MKANILFLSRLNLIHHWYNKNRKAKLFVNIREIIHRPLALFCLLIILLCGVLTFRQGYIDIGEERFDNRQIALTGTVQKKEVKNDKTLIYLKNAAFSGEENPLSDLKIKNLGVICYLKDASIVPFVGMKVRVSGQFTPFKKATNPGEFDLRKYYASTGYYFAVYDTKIVAYSESYSILGQELSEIREYCSSVYDGIYSERDAGILKAMVLGEKKDMDEDIKELYKRNGISHILSISGLHVSFIGMFLFGIFLRLRIRKNVNVFISLSVLWMYAFMTGLSVGTKRAVLMFSFFLISYLINRTYDLLTALLSGALVCVLYNPQIFFNSGFYLSYFAVIGISEYSRALEALNKKKGSLRKISDYVRPSVAVSFFTLPLILFSYYEYPLYSILINLMIVPFMSLLLGTALFSLLAGCISLEVGAAVGIPCHYILLFYEKICVFFEKLPMRHIIMGKPSVLRLILFYIFAFAFILLRRFLRKRERQKNEGEQIKPVFDFLFVMLVQILLLLLLIKPAYGMEITFLDVGQGDGMVINYKGTICMVDGGSTSEKSIGEYTLIPYLKSQGINKVDYWFISHPDEDHVNGLLQMLLMEENNIRVGTVLLPDAVTIKEDAEEIIFNLKEKSIPVKYIKSGDSFCIGEMTIDVLNPVADTGVMEANDYSEVLLLCYKGHSVLFTGDTSMAAEPYYLKELKKKMKQSGMENIEILKVAHHGSSYSTSMELIDSIKPECAVISYGKNNRYGHPGKEVIERLVEGSVTVLRTEKEGAICIKLNANEYKITSFLHRF